MILASQMEKAYLLFGLLSAMLYAIAASSLKTAADRGTRTLQTTLLANIVTALAFLMFLPWGDGNVWPASWSASLIVGMLFLAGQWLTFLALSKGHASVATPALGSKVVLVALILAFVFHRQVQLNVWIAAILTSAALGILAISPRGEKTGPITSTIIYSVAAAACYGMFDVLTQIWSREYTFGRLLPWAMVFAAIGAAPVTLALDRKVPKLTRASVGYLLLGVCLLTLQSLILIWAIAAYNDAAGLNVVYGSRGIWSVLLVWVFGHLFSHHERFHHPGLVVSRLLGAILIAAAVALVFWPFS